MKKNRWKALCAASLLATAACLSVVGCSADPENPVNGEDPVSEITDLSDENYVNLYGRTYYNENMQGMAFVNSASGFEVRFCGTQLTVSAQSSGAWESMFSVFVDGETDSNVRVVTVESSPFGSYDAVVLAQNLSDSEHTVKVFKRTPSNRDTTLISSVSTDGEFLPAPERPALKIDVYGDSIACGEGILREVTYNAVTGAYDDSKVYTANTQNAMQSYAAVAAQSLGAEFRIYGRGGIAMKYPYASTKHTVLENPAAVAVDLDPGEYPYDYASWTPDVVVIYLGANDYCARGVNADYSPDGLKIAFMQFLREVIGVYYGRDIPVVLCSGLMYPEAGLGEVMKNVKASLPEFANLDTVEFSPCAVGHPVVEENRVAGELLADKIREMFA
ncbi:MAG: hypothetical protein ACI4ST_05660 [Candidatus Gallimonas sp.]